MKTLLLDENLPVALKRHFSNQFSVKTVPDLGWQSKKNGELLAAMEAEGIEYLVTADRNLRFQQNLEKFHTRLVVIITYDTRLKSLIKKMRSVEDAIEAGSAESRIIEVDIRH